MKRISEISLCNYRAFLNKPAEEDKYKICLPKGENLLIYGENGSGKSSLFKGLKDFFESASNPALTPTGNIFSELEYPETAINLKLTEKQVNGTWAEIENLAFNVGSSTTPANSNILNSSTAFLTYRDILKTYLYADSGENPNLFDLFVYDLLGRITDEATNNYVSQELHSLEFNVSNLAQAILEICALPDDEDPSITKEVAIGRSMITIEELERLDVIVNPLNNQIAALLTDLFVTVNQYLKEYFKSNIHIELKEPEKIVFIEGDDLNFTLKKQLFIQVNYYGKVIDLHDYPSFLNEARLSAIAICLYLAAVKQDKPTIDNLKFLFLDDIFIGIDTTNRIPLLKILVDHFQNFQIFLSTYDREWFELSRRWLNQTSFDYKYIELYEGVDENTTPPIPYPIIIDPSLNNIEKARLYYNKKDYPAAANYLRKACEEKIKSILPGNMKFKESDGKIVEIDLLGELYVKFKEFCRLNELHIPALSQFETYTKIILNSLSHDDLKARHYKSEIEEALKIISEFDKIKTKKILKPKLLKTALSSKDDPTKTKHHYDIDLKENLYWIQYDTQPAKFSTSMCRLKGDSFAVELSFHAALIRLLNEHGYDPQTDYIKLCHSIQATNTKKLDEITVF